MDDDLFVQTKSSTSDKSKRVLITDVTQSSSHEKTIHPDVELSKQSVTSNPKYGLMDLIWQIITLKFFKTKKIETQNLQIASTKKTRTLDPMEISRIYELKNYQYIRPQDSKDFRQFNNYKKLP
ncbi:hypothetical protein HCN44_009616 [Aphidius gifuensis]|uniref:Uncharacterized protein n=1 Tax=Aphidius gifuensis TaxID=684658 RepID=A0A834Y2Q0_APHGI|nr:hypothetical protein HCN44_009616 [Aphidius gifuensis]